VCCAAAGPVLLTGGVGSSRPTVSSRKPWRKRRAQQQQRHSCRWVVQRGGCYKLLLCAAHLTPHGSAQSHARRRASKLKSAHIDKLYGPWHQHSKPTQPHSAPSVDINSGCSLQQKQTQYFWVPVLGQLRDDELVPDSCASS
jgi:hypothetical protein